jgi:hypothetical protein
VTAIASAGRNCDVRSGPETTAPSASSTPTSACHSALKRTPAANPLCPVPFLVISGTYDIRVTLLAASTPTNGICDKYVPRWTVVFGVDIKVRRVHVSTQLEPHEVDKPYLRRWLRDTAELFIRSPLRFGLLIAALGWLDTSAVNMTGLVIEKQWVQRFGMVLLPVVWTAVSAVARGADDASQTWAAVRSLARRTVWSGALTVGAVIAGLNWIVSWSLGGLVHLMVPARPAPYLHRPGELLESTGVNAVLVVAFVGLCYFPLLVLIPDISSSIARDLSSRASSLNDRVTMFLFVGTTALIADWLASVAPAYGMTMAATIVFLGVFNYVAYRDIFERRSGNLPKAAVSATGSDVRVQTSRLTSSCSGP